MTTTLGPLIIDLVADHLSAEERELLNHPAVGGVILFARHYQHRAQLKQLCQAIRSVRKDPLLIVVDQEGGRVQRFMHEFTAIPPMGQLGDYYQENPQIALDAAKQCAMLMAIELLSVGIDMSLAPVLDLNKKMNSVIGDRAFHADPRIVIALSTAWMQGMHDVGMASMGKHFPGHGSVTADSHLAVPMDARTFAQIEADDLLPFKALIKAGIKAIMPAHIVFQGVDTLPAGFSRIWLQTILREQLKFKGAIISDDLHMAGANISAHYIDRLQAARDAGCDFTLLCNHRAGVIAVLDAIDYKKHQVPEDRWRPLQSQFKAQSWHADDVKKISTWVKQFVNNMNSFFIEK